MKYSDSCAGHDCMPVCLLAAGGSGAQSIPVGFAWWWFGPCRRVSRIAQCSVTYIPNSWWLVVNISLFAYNYRVRRTRQSAHIHNGWSMLLFWLIYSAGQSFPAILTEFPKTWKRLCAIWIYNYCAAAVGKLLILMRAGFLASGNFTCLPRKCMILFSTSETETQAHQQMVTVHLYIKISDYFAPAF